MMTWTSVGELTLDGHPRGVRVARRFLNDIADAVGIDAATVDLAALAVSEIVTNAIIHVGGDVRNEASIVDGDLRIAVTDHGSTSPALRALSDDGDSGRGLAIVAAVAGDWGVELLDDNAGKTVWFTVRI